MMKAIIEYGNSLCTHCFMEHGRCEKTLGGAMPQEVRINKQGGHLNAHHVPRG